MGGGHGTPYINKVEDSRADYPNQAKQSKVIEPSNFQKASKAKRLKTYLNEKKYYYKNIEDKTVIGIEQFEVYSESCYHLAENWAAISPWIGAHRYKSVLCSSKLLWV